MAISKKLKKYLDKEKIEYKTKNHDRVITAQEVAESIHVPGKELAKSIVIRDGDKYHLFVLPATKSVDFSQVRKLLNTHHVDLADEADFETMFSDCELGAMPPFGNIYGLETFVDQELKEDEDIAFNAGTHSDVILMHFSDFDSLVHPTYASFAA